MERTASKQLVVELASGRTSSFEISEDQRVLKIPPHIVYLVGILFAEEELNHQQRLSSSSKGSKSIVRIRNERFETLQKQYLALVRSDDRSNFDTEAGQNSLKPSPRIFLLTGRLRPIKELQAIVNQDLTAIYEKLEYQANEAVVALLKEESRSSSSSPSLSSSSSSSSSKRNNQQRKQSKQRPGKKKAPESQARCSSRRARQKITAIKAPPDDGEISKIRKTIEEVVAAKVQDSIDSTEGKSWVKIKRNGDSRTERNSTATSLNLDRGRNKEEVDAQFSSISIELDNKLTMTMSGGENNDEHLNIDPPDSQDCSSLKITNPYTENINSVAKKFIAHGEDTLSSLRDNIPISSNLTVENRLATQVKREAILKQNLTDLKQQLIEERLAHTKKLRKDKERYEDLIQALQLRLYIGETKLITYEDALQKHIQAVSTLSFNTTKKSDEELIPSSPSLLSKVIENKKNQRFAFG